MQNERSREAPAARDAREANAAPLSAREREVLALVAAGLTNRGISERLVISLGTTDRHVHNILTKLGCANRTEAAAFARSGGNVQAWVPVQPGRSRTRFVGRSDERARLSARLVEAKAGGGNLTMVVGEPGIGKTRLTEEVAREAAAAAGFSVLWGRCYEGDWAPPYAPFAEALAALARNADLRELRSDLGFGGPPLARIAPLLRERLPDLPEPAPLGPNEEQFRILDGVLQLLVATARRRPLLLVIDDLHWADAGTLNMLRYVSRFLKESLICLVGSYRDVELDRQHPLGAALVELRREAGYERILLRGLEDAAAGELAEAIAERELDAELLEAIRLETGGNPLFIREMLLSLIEEGAVAEGTLWTKERGLSIPESVRQVIGRRLSRLSDEANRLLSAASAFSGPFRFDVTAEAAELEERPALDAVDAAVAAQLIHAGGMPDTYEFGHALIAHTLYTELNPSRQVRLHRRIAEALSTKPDAPAAEVAYQYHRSAALPGAEAGVAWAMKAGDEAAASYAWAQVVTFCEMALDPMAPDDERRAEVTGRLGLALPSVQKPAEAIAAMKFWAGTLFERGMREEGLEYLFQGHRSLTGLGFEAPALELAKFAEPRFVGLGNQPTIWFRLLLLRHDEETAPAYIGIARPSHEKSELLRAWDALPNPSDVMLYKSVFKIHASRAEVLSTPRASPMWAGWVAFFGGEFRETAVAFGLRATAALREGRLDEAGEQLAYQGGCHIAMGNLDLARELLAQATDIARRIPFGGSFTQVGGRKQELASTLDIGWEARDATFAPMIADRMAFRTRWAAAPLLTGAARVKARLGFDETALELISLALPAIESAPGGSPNYPRLICQAAFALWDINTPKLADVLDRNLREKMIVPDFRSLGVDARLSLAHVSALQGRIDEAHDWFAKARAVLEEQGARPLRAICDHDEALALVRHSRKTGLPLDRERVLALLAAAQAQFEEIGMTGWIERAKVLRADLGGR